MKSTLITLTAIASFVGYSSATLTFKDPWSKTKAWKSGEKAEVKWTSDAADADKLCDIQMLNGDKLNSNIVAMVTNPQAPVKCGTNQFEIAPLNDFKSGEYWLRIGQASSNTWSYSSVFNFEGKGTANPLKLADGTTHYPSVVMPKQNKQQDSTRSSAVSNHSVSKSATAPIVPKADPTPVVKKENKDMNQEKKSSGGNRLVNYGMEFVLALIFALIAL
ncbi:hypothetical protein BC941DRAFT_448971 [Chlamydoabsidia padenii]|nr:hypothetical protein BC941DRAFT_448971 [Chlamydoabsidia padenii]